MTIDGARFAGFPPNSGLPIRVDSVAEEYAYLGAYPAATGRWRMEMQVLVPMVDQFGDEIRVRAPGGEAHTVAFAVGSFFGGSQPVGPRGNTMTYLDRLMGAAEAFARENGPHHPGSLPRFPVPSARYPGRVEVPMAVLAVEDGRRGLYAPPRVVTVDFGSAEAHGIGNFPGFEVDDWPPPRLGDWPPSMLAGVDREQLSGLVGRFSAVWCRLIDVWLGGEDYPQRTDEIGEGLRLRATLDLPEMAAPYRRLNPEFADWLNNGAAAMPGSVG